MMRLVAAWGLAWLAIGIYAHDQVKRSAPAENWMDVKSVVVHPAFEGAPPLMTVGLIVKQKFVGEWSATVRRFTHDGTEVVCTATGKNEYKSESMLPKNLNLDWWTFPVKCQLPVGTYRVDTVWTIKPDGYPEKHLIRDSNVFEVRPKG